MDIFDGHSDSLVKWYLGGARSMHPFLTEQATQHLDLPRARQGGLIGGICAICVPPTAAGFPLLRDRIALRPDGFDVPLPEPIEPAWAEEFALDMMTRMRSLADHHPDQLATITSASDIDRMGDDDRFWLLMHLEGAESIRADLSNLDRFYEAGLRSIGPVWSRPNAFGHGVPFVFPSSPDTGPGLTDAGRMLIAACNQRGILIDLSHMTERGFRDVAEITTAPLVVSHTGAHALAPSARNLTDAQLDRIGESGGLVGITFHVADLNPDGSFDPATPIDRIVDHIDYIARRIGVEHVALGSDFDGAIIPAEMKDATGLPILLNRLQARGFSSEDRQRIASDNWERILKAVLGER
ncbi:peptidase [candidate division GN15 bacterium]|nr:peptidase [candidate division GN15 bacterium]